ncbi:large ribosomal subunit protein eL20z-like isoform X2 [Euphorbia lathyris]|uniref:large ribosomal subunit protein eL20z-like isoform X2 n=1 Tax=Euphorbia lathyris TaxID=212925 RepID=UPI003313F3FD
MADEGKNRGVASNLHNQQQQQQQYYGTFQGVANYYPPPPSHPVVGFPQPVAPHPHGLATANPQYYSHGYNPIVTGYALIDGRPVREHRLPCCGMGMGWLLFIVGFFLGGIPWYVGTFILLCVQVDYREKPGYVACAIATILAVIAITLGATKGANAW